jgi:probable HAF family extracellular repeat protein
MKLFDCVPGRRATLNVAAFGFIAFFGVTHAVQAFNINGRITTSGGRGVAGVTVTATGFGIVFPPRVVTTDGNGNYTIDNTGLGDYTITPTKAGLTFSPPSRGGTLPGLTDVHGVDFSLQTGSLQGRVTSGGFGVSGVTVTATGVGIISSPRVVTTDGNGNYTINDTGPGDYTVTPTRAGMVFSPPSRSGNLTGFVLTSGIDFAVQAGSLHGRITSGGQGVSGVTVTATGVGIISSPRVVTTDGNGNYTINATGPGAYTVTPTKTGLTFSPPNRSGNIPGSGDITGVDFALQSGTLRGRVTSGPFGIGGVTVTQGGGRLVTFQNLAIPDANATGITATHPVPLRGTIRDVAVGVLITHPYIGDLEVTLIHPDGTERRLHNRTGGDTDNIGYGYYSGPGAVDDLRGLNGKPAEGNWRLRVRDLAGANTGTLVWFDLAITSDTVTDASGAYDLGGFSLWDLAGFLYPPTLSVSRSEFTFTPPSQGAIPGVDRNFTVASAPIKGRVTTRNSLNQEVPVLNARVELADTLGGGGGGVYTDANGNWVWAGGAAGRLYLTAVAGVYVGSEFVTALGTTPPFTTSVVIGKDNVNFLITASTPSISSIDTVNMLEDTSHVVSFTVADLQTPSESLTPQVSSTNANLLASLTLGGSGANRTLTITPRPNTYGTTLITIQVNDGSYTVVREFRVNVIVVNDQPVAGPLSSVRLDGNNQFVLTPDIGPGISANTAHTLEMWVRPDSIYPGLFASDFQSGVPAGMTLHYNANVSGGHLRLTAAQGGQAGVASINDFGGGALVDRFRASFKLALFGGSAPPADGFSFNLVPAATGLPWQFYEFEEGLSEGLAVNIDTWDNGGGEAPAIEVKWLGNVLARVPHQASAGAGVNDPNVAAREVLINLDPDGTIDVSYGGQKLIRNLPTGYNSETIGVPRWLLAARTGGAFDNHWVDDLRIEAPAGTPNINARRMLARVGPNATGAHYWMLNPGADGTNSLLACAVHNVRFFIEGVPIPADRWTHLAGVWNPATTTYTLYRNGFQAAQVSANIAFNLGSAPVPLTVGEGFAGVASFRGNVDDARLWNRALTELEIRANLNYPLNGTEPGLQVYHRFDETTGSLASDSAPTGARTDGVLLNGADYGIPASVREAGALRFDGVDDYVTVPNFGAVAPTTEVTVEFWQRVNAVRASSAFSLGPETPNNRFNAHVPWSDGVVYWDFGAWLGFGRLSYTPPANSTVGQWQHWAFVASQSGNYMRIFRNGVQVAQKAGMTPRTQAGAENWDLKIGSAEPVGNYAASDIDEFRVWNVARSAAEILNGYTNSLVGSQPGLVAYYRFDEGSGTVVADGAQGAYYGNIIGNPSWTEGALAPATLPPFGVAFVDEDTPRRIFLSAFDVEQHRGEAGGNLTFTVVTPPAHGTLSALSGNWLPTNQNPVTYTPATNYNGADSFTYRINDGSNGVSGVFTVPILVRDANDKPTITSIADLVIEENTSSPAIPFTVSDSDHPPGDLVVDPTWDDQTLIPVGNIVLTGTGNNRTVTITPAPGEVGTATITLNVNDGQDPAETPAVFRIRVVPRPAYAILDLGTLPGRAQSFGRSLNRQAWVAGSAQSQASDARGFLFKGIDGDRSLTDLGTAGGQTTEARGINDSNLVTGFATTANSPEAFRWSNGVMTTVGRFLGGTFSEGNAINNLGWIAGRGDTNGATRAFLYGGVSTILTNLGTLAGGNYSEANGLNDAGDVVGYSTIIGNLERGFIYRAGSMSALTPLSGHTASRAFGVNQARQIAGYSQTQSPGGPRRAVIWDGATLAPRDLGIFSGGTFSAARSINEFGQVVGQADRAGSTRAFLHSAGRLHDLNDLLPSEDADVWTLQEARAINADGFITGTGVRSGAGTRAFLAAPAWVIGRPIARPEGTVKRLPEIEILRGNAQDTPQNSFFWSVVENRLYAIRPVTARIKWFTSFTDVIGTGTNLTVNTERVITVGIAVWPRTPTLHVANTPTDIQPQGVPFDYSFQSVIYNTADGINVEPSTRRFTAVQPGYAVLQYLKNNGFSPRPDVHPPAFDVVRTVLWNDPKYLTDSNALVGESLRHPAHFDYGGRNGFVFFPKSFHDAAGADRAYDRDTRLGAIIPVNRPTPVTLSENSELVVVWYSSNRLGVAWSGIPVRYSLAWPVNAPKIIIASGLGSGPLDPLLYPDMRVYNQPDKTLPGYNPNEEHALIVPSSTGQGLYALRNDLNASLNVSDPFALLKHRDPATGEWRIRVHQVVTEEAPYFFNYAGEAGKEIQAPFPIRVLTTCAGSYPYSSSFNAAFLIYNTAAWEDVNGKIYARAAGPEGGNTNIIVRWFYPLQPGFYYDLDRNGTNDVPTGDCLALLDRRPGGAPGVPIDVTYNIRWPDSPPVLQIGETLLGSRRELPNVKDMAAVKIIYDDLNPNDLYNSSVASLARFYDPVSARTIPLPAGFVWPANIARQNIGGKEYFPGLPYALKVRLYHDPINRSLTFEGLLDEDFTVGPNPLLLPNVMSPRELERIKELAGGNPAWAAVVTGLFNLTRNPNRVDLDRDGQPDPDLRLGLTSIIRQIPLNNISITNVVPEQFGDGPKALSAGLANVPPPPTRPGFALRFDSATSSVNLGAGVTLGGTFTEEAWLNPLASVSTNYYGILGNDAAGQTNNRAPSLWIFDQTRIAYGFGDGAAWRFGLTAPVLTINEWNHVAASFDGTAYRIFVNGLLVLTDTNFNGQVPLATPVRFIGQSVGGHASFPGQIDEVRLWNVARSGDEIRAAMRKRLNGAESGLVGLWRFDEGAGVTVNDASSSGRNGTLAGVSWVNLESPGPAPRWGIPPRFITLAENNAGDLPGLSVGLHVIRVDDGPYAGDLKVMPADNIFDERVSMRHSSDFGGAPERMSFQWYYKPDHADFDATDLPQVNPSTGELVVGQERGWFIYPVTGAGVNDITLGEGGESSLLTLGDNWFICRYRGYNVNGETNWSDWIGDPGGLGQPRAQLVEGWVKRVIRGLNPFDARTKDFHSAPTATYASMLVQAGARFEGPIAFNPDADNVNSIGLIDAYTTVLNRARNLSVDGVPPVNFDPANNALLLAASRISDLYMLLGNEAYADAQDPTIGFGTSSGEYGALASTIFTFQNQLDSLLEEELVLLRGRDDRRGSVRAEPVYNRLIWNFTLGDGEVAYRQTYNIRDQNVDGFIDERDARLLYPQAHGDAWGHYLTAIKNYYALLQHTNFTWKPRTENVLVAGTAVEVDFLDERKFARIAAAKARAGRDIVDLTYRLNYVEDPSGQWQGYKDTDENRAWGVDDWARRAGQGAYLDWLAANAVLPSVDPNPAHTGIEKIDRQTVAELREISAQAIEVQSRLDQADVGLNPVGIAKGSVPFDIDPTFLEVGSTAQIGRRAVQGLTQFDQILERAVKAVKNGVAVWDEANRATELLRRTQDTVDDFTRNVREQEFDYKNRLIEIFGYPYAGDIGAGKTYESGYDGPDLYHYMYISTRTATGQNSPPATEFTSFFRPLPNGTGWTFTPTDYTYDPLTTDSSILAVNFPQSTASYSFDAPASWGSRRAPGELQLALSDLVQAENNFKLALQNYDGLIQDIKAQNELLIARGVLKTDIILKLETGKTNIIDLNRAILGMASTRIILSGAIETVKDMKDAAIEAFPKVIGLATDTTSAFRAILRVAGSIAVGVIHAASTALEIGELSQEQAKEVAALTTEIEVQKLTEDFEILQMKKELEHLIRDEISRRLELYTQAEVVHQTAGRYLQKLAEGERLVDELVRFRKTAAAEVTEYRYEDMTFRIFRNDAIQKYRASFDIAARYVYLAANAYDYEINFLRTDQRAGSRFLTEIVRQRNLGQLIEGEPSVGRPGLCDMLGRMVSNWEVLKPQFGVLTPQIADTRFSLREELFRIRGHLEPDLGPDGVATTPEEIAAVAEAEAANAESDASWQSALTSSRVSDLWSVPEFRRYCRPFAPEILGPQPGLVIRFPTTITFGQNFFGWPLAGGDSAYDPTQFSTKIARAGVWFSGSDGSMVSQTPRIYLVPVGMDIQRAPTGDTLATREWRIIDQVVPPPFPIGANDLDSAGWIPMNDSLGGNFAQIRRYGSFAAKHDDGIYSEDDLTNDTRLIGRSAWNTEWLMIIPGGTLLADPNEGLDTLIDTVNDIKIYFQTYSYSGN